MKSWLFLILLVTLQYGCAPVDVNQPVVRFSRQVEYVDSKSVELVTNEFGSTDLQLIAEKMVSSLLQEEALLQDRPLVKIGKIKNKTSEYIDTANIMSSISTQLTQSRKVKVAAPNEDNQALVDELAQQNQSGLYDKNTTAKIGKAKGPKFLLDGELTSIVKQSSKTKDVYYKFTLKMRDIEENIIEWQEEKDIRKVSKR